MFKSIVVPVDGSDYAAKAVAVASEFVEKHEAKLTLLHVMHRHGSARVPPGFTEYAKLEHLEVTEHDFFMALSAQILNKAERRMQELGVAPSAKETLVGDPGHMIAEYANEHGADLIVMGCRGLSDLKGLLLGSVSHKVSHLANCACMLVK